jgi:hypothetical protein
VAELESVMSSFLERLKQAKAKLAERNANPLREKVEAVVRAFDAVSTVALLDLIGLPKTTANGRRIAPTMRSLGFVPIKSRRLMPGGWRDTVTRGWARPVREVKHRSSLEGRDKVAALHANALVHHRPI